jgi:hypothetical protein
LQRRKAFTFSDADFANGGSDRLVDPVVASGSGGKIHQRFAAAWA